MITTTFTVTGMTCSHCENSVRAEVSEVAGVRAVEVAASTGTLSVTSDRPVIDADILAAVTEAGYQAERAS